MGKNIKTTPGLNIHPCTLSGLWVKRATLDAGPTDPVWSSPTSLFQKLVCDFSYTIRSRPVSASVCFSRRCAHPPTGGTAAFHSEVRKASTSGDGETDSGHRRGGGKTQDGVSPSENTAQHNSPRERIGKGTTHLLRRRTNAIPECCLCWPLTPPRSCFHFHTSLVWLWSGEGERLMDVCASLCVCVCEEVATSFHYTLIIHVACGCLIEMNILLLLITAIARVMEHLAVLPG